MTANDPSGLSNASLQCRDLRHSWDVADQAVRDQTLVRVLTCFRCRTTRTDEYTWPGLTSVSRSYKYPADYQIKRLPGDRRYTAQDIRTEWYRRYRP